MAKKKLYKTTYTIEVLTEENETYDLEGLVYEVTDGGASGGGLHVKRTVELVGKDAVKACEKQGTDPEFFRMDEEGNNLDENIDDMLNDRFGDLLDQEHY